MLCWWCGFWRLVMLSCMRMSRCLRMLFQCTCQKQGTIERGAQDMRALNIDQKTLNFSLKSLGFALQAGGLVKFASHICIWMHLIYLSWWFWKLKKQTPLHEEIGPLLAAVLAFRLQLHWHHVEHPQKACEGQSNHCTLLQVSRVLD